MTEDVYSFLIMISGMAVVSCSVVGFIVWLVCWAAKQDSSIPHPDDRLVTREWLSKTKAEYDAEIRN